MHVTQTITRRAIHWQPVWALAALYGSIIIGWIAYFNYQPRLLEKFGLLEFKNLLIIGQGLILALAPPVAGALGDRYRKTSGSRLPVITLGISFAAMIFMAVAFTLLNEPTGIVRWVFPGLIVCWLISMCIFTSPAISTIELFGSRENMPQIMAVLTILSNLLFALEPVIVDIIDFVGAPLTFILGGVLVFTTGSLLTRSSLPLVMSGEITDQAGRAGTRSRDYGFVFMAGLGLGAATALLINVFPLIIPPYAFMAEAGISARVVVCLTLAVAALLSWPASQLTRRFPIDRLIPAAIALMVVASLGVFTLNHAVLLGINLLIFAAGFSLLSVIAFPWALTRIRSANKVLGAGIFFSGLELPKSVLEILLLN
jgi:hypothetical protein